MATDSSKQKTAETSPTETSDRNLMKGPIRTRQESITVGTAAFLAVPTNKVFDVLRGIWTVSKGQPPLTNQELMIGMALIVRYELDPFAREIYVTRDKKGRLMTIIGVDGWIRILDRTDHYDGFERIEEEDKDGNLISVETIIHSKERKYPARYKARMDEYMKLGGFMAGTIPRHMLGIFSLRHAGRLFIPMGTVVTEEEARYMQADAEPAKTLDDLTKEMGDRSGVNLVYRELVNNGAAAARKPAEPVTEAEPAFDAPSAEEVANAQHQLAEEFIQELGKADSKSRVEELAKGINEAYVAHTLREDQFHQLDELVVAVKVALNKV